MGLGRYVVDGIVLEGRSPGELARSQHISRARSTEARLKFGMATTTTSASARTRSMAAAVSPRYLSQLRHIYVGRAHRGERIRLLIAGTDVRIVREDGQLLGQTTLDPERNYQPLRRPAIVHDHPRQVSSIT